MDLKADIQARLSIEEVIGQYVELKRSGRNFKGLSPFNAEKTPSFVVSPDKGIWHDFSSGRGGNMFSFIMEVESVEFREALEILAKQAGLNIEDYRSKGNADFARRKKRLEEIVELSTKFFQQNLLKNSQALDYLLKKRHFKRNTIANFRIGYSPDTPGGLVRILLNKGYTNQEIKDAGVGTDRYGKLGDMFRGRIMVPLMDSNGLVIGFTARLLQDNPNAPKYINTPKTILYDKSSHIFGLHLAKESIRKLNFVVIVEGNLDVTSAHQAGFSNVVATAGTAMTANHLKSMSRYTSDIRLCFDGDKAGVNATVRAIELAQGLNIQLSVISLKDAKDPDELISKNPKLWEEAVNSNKYAVDWLISKYQQEFDLTSAQGKKSFSDILLRTISKLNDDIERDHYSKQISDLLGVNQQAVDSKLNQQLVATVSTIKKTVKTTRYQNLDNVLQMTDQLLALLYYYPLTRRVLDTLDHELQLLSRPRQQLIDYLKINSRFKPSEDLPAELQPIKEYISRLSLISDEKYDSFDTEQRLRDATELIVRLERELIKLNKQHLLLLLQTAENSSNEDEITNILQKIKKLNELEKRHHGR